MISEHLTADIGRQFPEKGFQLSQSSQPVASLASPCEALGSLEIHDDGDEATVYITGATHSHFGCYEECLSNEEKERRISSDVMGFLKALLADRVVVVVCTRRYSGRLARSGRGGAASKVVTPCQEVRMVQRAALDQLANKRAGGDGGMAPLFHAGCPWGTAPHHGR